MWARIHYNRWTYVGGSGPDIARAYRDYPIPAELKAGGKTWFVGARGGQWDRCTSSGRCRWPIPRLPFCVPIWSTTGCK